MASHQIQFSEQEEAVKEKVEGVFVDAGMNVPNMKALIEQLPEYASQSVGATFYALVNLGRLIKIADDFFIHIQTFQRIMNLLTGYLQENDIVTIAEFREFAETSRKYAVPFLEYCDGEGITIREGNHRRLRKSAQQRA